MLRMNYWKRWRLDSIGNYQKTKSRLNATSEQSENENVQVADLQSLNEDETNERVLEDSTYDSVVNDTIEQSD